jgi:MFS family permease
VTGNPRADADAAAPEVDGDRPPRVTYVVGFADSFGLGIYLAFSAVYFNQVLGLDNTKIGVILGASGVASVVGAIPIGKLADRLGPRIALRGLFLLRALSFVGLAVASSFTAALVAASVAGLLSRGIGPIIQSTVLTAGTGDAVAVRALARLRSLRNGGIAIGALPASVAISSGDPLVYRLVLTLSAVLFVVCAGLSGGFTTRPAGRRRAGASVSALANLPFLGITALYGLLTLSAIVLGVGLPLWIVQRTHAPAWSVGLIQLLNTVLVVTAQVHFSRGTERIGRAKALMCWGGLTAAAAALLVPITAIPSSAWVALVAVVAVVLLFTLAEMCTTAGGMGAALAHLPNEDKATYLATFNLGFGAATVAGPSMVGAAIGLGWWGWAGWSALFVVAGLLTFLIPGKVRPPGR